MKEKCGGSVAVLVKSTIRTETFLNTSELNCAQMETVWVKVRLDQRRSLIIACIYRSPSTAATQNERDFDEIDHSASHSIDGHHKRRLQR